MNCLKSIYKVQGFARGSADIQDMWADAGGHNPGVQPDPADAEFHGLDKALPAGPWGSGAAYARLKQRLGEIELSDSLRFSFDVMFRELEQLRQLKRELLQQLRKLARSVRYRESVRLLMSAPGIGKLTAVRLVL